MSWAGSGRAGRSRRSTTPTSPSRRTPRARRHARRTASGSSASGCRRTCPTCRSPTRACCTGSPAPSGLGQDIELESEDFNRAFRVHQPGPQVRLRRAHPTDHGDAPRGAAPAPGASRRRTSCPGRRGQLSPCEVLQRLRPAAARSIDGVPVVRLARPRIRSRRRQPEATGGGSVRVIGVVDRAGRRRPAGDRCRRLLQPVRPAAQPRAGVLAPDRRRAHASPRPGPQPGRDGQGLRRPRARHLRGRDRRAGRRGRAWHADRPSRRSRRTSSPARCASCSRSPRPIPTSRPSTFFQQLQPQLAETEDRIAAGRRFYNANVRALNTRVQSFPSS